MIWTMEPTAKKLEDVETKVGNVGSTDLQSQVNTLSSKINDITIMSNSAGTFSTLAELATILNTAISSMNNFEIKRIRVDCSATVYPFTNGYGYDVELYRFSGSTYVHANFYSGGRLPIYVGVKDLSGWSFDELALNSNSIKCVYGKGVVCRKNTTYTVTLTSNRTYVMMVTNGSKSGLYILSVISDTVYSTKIGGDDMITKDASASDRKLNFTVNNDYSLAQIWGVE